MIEIIVEEISELDEIKFETGKVYHQDTNDGPVYFKAGEQQKNKRWKGLVLDIGKKKPKSGSADETLRFWKATPDSDIPPSLKEAVQLAERTGYSNFIPFPRKVLTDFAKRAKKAGLEWESYKKFVKQTFKDGADERSAYIFGRDVYYPTGKQPNLEEVDLDETKKVALECQECGKKFSKANPNSNTKCPKCKSTDIDLDYSKKEEISTSSDIDMNPTGKQGKEVWWPKNKKKKKLGEARKYETFSVSDDCFHKFRHGKVKFERWSKYLDLKDESQKRIYDWAKRNHKGVMVLHNATTGAVRGIRYNRTGGGQWGKLSRIKEQFLQGNDSFSQLNEDVLDILKNIAKNKQNQSVKFKDKKTASVDHFTANAMVEVYNAINKDNQSKFKEMINKNLQGFLAMQSFAMKQIK